MAGANFALRISEEAREQLPTCPSTCAGSLADGWTRGKRALPEMSANWPARRTDIACGWGIIEFCFGSLEIRFRCMPSVTGKKRMINALEKPGKRGNKPRLSLATPQRQLRALQQRVEDLENLRELNQAIEQNGGKPLLPWAKVKHELGLDPG